MQDTPLEKIDNEYTMGMKRVNDIYDQTSWRPSFYFNPREDLPDKEERFIGQNIKDGIACFINKETFHKFGEHDNVYYIDRKEWKREPVTSIAGNDIHSKDFTELEKESIEESYRYWSDDPAEFLYTYNSMFAAIQLAVYFGFDEIYLLGCDLGYDYHDPHMIFDTGVDPMDYSTGPKDFLTRIPAFLKGCLKERVVLRSMANAIAFLLFLTPLAGMYIRFTQSILNSGDPNHFSSTYRVMPKDNRYANEEIRRSHIVVKKILEDLNIDIYNATVGGELEVYERVDIEEIL
ncbi:hypothetical protein GCM10028858_21520 [Halorubrum pallidum]